MYAFFPVCVYLKRVSKRQVVTKATQEPAHTIPNSYRIVEPAHSTEPSLLVYVKEWKQMKTQICAQ